MDQPVLHILVERLRAEERLQQLAAALPTRVRVSEPILPLLLAALHEELDRGLIVLLPEDADARDAAEAAAWFVGEDRVALFPSRGVHWGSGLEPPPHLVGERARALEVLEQGGLVCASATAIAEGLPPIPESLQKDVARYLEFRSASFHSWHPQKHEMLISTRFADAVSRTTAAEL